MANRPPTRPPAHPARSPAGYFRTPNPIAVGPAGAKVAMCSACEGCTADKCGAGGCTTCPPGLGWTLQNHPTLQTMAGAAAKVCRPSTGSPTVRRRCASSVRAAQG